MNNLRFLLLIVSIILSKSLFAQDYLEGYVKDKKTKGTLPGVTLTIKNIKDEIKAYSITDNNGYYKIPIHSFPDSIFLEARCMGYGTQRLQIAPTNLRYDYYLEEKVFQLTEVNVQGEKITQRGDTITYSAPSFTSVKDRSLEDILKKMPGISVNGDGSIQYNGRGINRFYIEGMNLLDGQYSLASRNLSPDKVASVQVLENHQPIKALENTEFSDRAALNIKLKKNTGSQWLANGDIAIGASPFLWQARAFSMFVAPKQQGLFSYKGNNTGVDILSELNVLPLDELVSGLYTLPASSLFTSLFLSSPDLSVKRSFFNQSHLITLNQLWKYKTDTDIRLNMEFIDEEQNQNNEQRTEYFQTDTSSRVFSEKAHIQSKLTGVKGKLSFIRNKKNYYLENKTTGSGRWQNVHSDISSGSSINQKEKLPQFTLLNQFRLLRSWNKMKFRLISLNQYENLPQDLYVNITGATDGLSGFQQKAGQKILISNIALQLDRSFGRWSFSNRLEYDLKMHQIDAMLLWDDQSVNNKHPVFKRWSHQVGITPGITLTKNRWNAEVKFPVKWEKMNDRSNDEIRWYCNPTGMIRFTPNNNWSLNFIGNYINYYENLSSVVSNRMINYRTQYRYNGELPFTRTLSLNAFFSYRNIISAFFSNINYSYQKVYKDNIQSRIIEGNYIINNLIKHYYSTESHSLSGEINKLIKWQELNLKLSIRGHKDHFSIMQNKLIQPYTIWSAMIKPQFELTVFKQNTLSYKMEYTLTKQIASGESNSNYKMLKQDFSLFWVLFHDLNLTITGEHFYNQFDGGNSVNIFLADMELRCNLIKCLEMTAKWSNIFNKRYYSYSYFTELSEAFYSYKIRPTELLISLNYKF